MDPEILRNFEVLRSTLRWRPLTANLESCENGRFLFFRITLRLGPSGETYAGFSSGAPFMLTRDGAEKKRGFFLRHWVRQDEHPVDVALPYFDSKHLCLAIVKDVMIVRVDVDREMQLADTFKSVPFATWMFQVVQVDALIDGKNGIRFAFAIERTVTAEERTIIQGNVEHTKQQTKIQKAASKTGSNLRVPPVRIPASLSQASCSKPTNLQGSLMSTVNRAPNTSQNTVGSKLVAQPRMTSHRSVTIANPSGIVSKTLNPRNAVTLSSTPAGNPSGLVNGPVQAARARPIARANESQKVSAQTPPPVIEKKVFHPLLRLWENHVLEDPYEPIFIVKSDEYTQRTSEAWQVEDTSRAGLQFHFKLLQSLPGADFPAYLKHSLDANHYAESADDLFISHPAKRMKCSDRAIANPQQDFSRGIVEDPLVHVENDSVKAPPVELRIHENRKQSVSAPSSTKLDSEEIPLNLYVSTVRAAAEYNCNLEADRIELQNWLVEDRRVREADGSNDEDDLFNMPLSDTD